MSAKTPFVVAVALAGSLGLHLAGFGLSPSPEVKIEGGAPSQIAMLGNSFADMIEGSISAPTPNDVTEPVEQVDETEPVEQTETAQPVEPPDKAKPVKQVNTVSPVNDREDLQSPQPKVTAPVRNPEPIETPQKVSSAPLIVAESRTNPVVPLIETPTAPGLEPVLHPLVTAAISAAETLPSVEAPTARPVSRPAPPEMAQPSRTLVTQAALAPVTPEATVTAQSPVQVLKATPETLRPLARPAKPAKPKPASAPASRKGSEQSTKKGQATGTKTGQTATSSPRRSTSSSQAGNAAVANYPGIVMRKISRNRKERAGVKGKATVGFKISASGAINSIRILRGSGSAKIDSIALRHIRRASPFPPPPKGARRSFSVEFVSKR